MDHATTQIGLADDEDILLDIAALDLAALDHPKLSLAPYRARLDAMAADLAREGASLRAATDRAALLAEVIAVDRYADAPAQQVAHRAHVIAVLEEAGYAPTVVPD